MFHHVLCPRDSFVTHREDRILWGYSSSRDRLADHDRSRDRHAGVRENVPRHFLSSTGHGTIAKKLLLLILDVNEMVACLQRIRYVDTDKILAPLELDYLWGSTDIL